MVFTIFVWLLSLDIITYVIHPYCCVYQQFTLLSAENSTASIWGPQNEKMKI